MISLMNGYHLHRTTNLESSVGNYPDIFFSEDPLADPVYIVVQNAGLGEWLVRFLAYRLGAVMGPRILMPEQALRRFISGYPAGRRLLGMESPESPASSSLLFLDGMKLLLFKALEESLESGDSEFSQVASYVGTHGAKRLWDLADSLAGTFHHYGMNCLPLVEAWDKDEDFGFTDPEDQSSEIWQRRLWRRILGGGASYTHLSQILSIIRSDGAAYDGETCRLVLFGSMFLGESGLEFFRNLAREISIHHIVLSPFHSMIRDEPRQFFLRTNGRLAAGFDALLHQLAPDSIENQEPDSVGDGQSSLARLRSSLSKDEGFNGQVDESITFHNISGVRRSIEVLKDLLVEAFRDDPTLAPTQIGVLAPDISRFVPFIESIFHQADSLPYNITDLPGRSKAPYPSAFQSLIELPGSRFGRGTILELLGNPCFSPMIRDAQMLESWTQLIDDLHVRWGIDAQHRLELGAADGRSGAWATAFERLLAGYYHDEGDDPGLLPVVLAGEGEAEAAGRLISTIRRLDEDFRNLNGQRLTIREWTLLWEQLMERWIVPRRDEGLREEDQKDRLRIKKAVRDLLALSEDVSNLDDFQDSNIPWVAFSTLLQEIVDQGSHRRGRYLAQGITFASLKPMRAIPFRRIYILGLDEGVWPGRENLTGFDLRDRIPKAIDLSRESVDRFALLETLFSASEHVSLFFTGRDPERGDSLEPAGPVVELLDHLGKAAWEGVRRHPLAPYDVPATTSRHILALAAAGQQEPVPREPPRPLVPLPKDEDAIDWRELTYFLKNPVRYFFQKNLGTAVESQAADRDEDDILEADSLEWWSWRDTHISEDPDRLRDPEKLVDDFRKQLVLQGAVAVTPAWNLQLTRWTQEAESLAAQLERLERDGLDTGPKFSVRLAGAGGNSPSWASQLEEVFQDGGVLNLPSLEVSPAEASPLNIIGSIGGLKPLTVDSAPEPDIWTMVDFVSGKTPRSVSNRRSWVAALVLASALGERCPREIRIFRIGGRDFKARRYFFDEAQRPQGDGGEKVFLQNPPGILQRLVQAFRDGETAPLVLYPELADALGRAAKQNPGMEPSREAAVIWNATVSNGQAPYSELRDCPWRRYMDSVDFDTLSFRRAWEQLYVEGGLLWI